MKLPPTYCISCEQTERPAKARQHFAAAGVPARFVQGIYGRQWGLETRLWTHQVGDGYKIDPGHVGLCLSHWLVWQLALDRGCDEVLICEDDAIFCAGFLERFAEHRAELPDDWQIWYVGSLGPFDGLKPASAHLVSTEHRGMHGTHCYLVRASALPVLINRCQEARLHIDQGIGANAMPFLVGYASSPSLVDQHSANGTWPHAVGGHPEPSDPPAILPGAEADLAGLASVQGWCCPEKRRAIYDCVREIGYRVQRPMLGVELGVFGGQSLFAAALGVRDVPHGGRLIGIDPYTTEAAVDGLEAGGHRDWWANVDLKAVERQARATLEQRGLGRWCEIRACMPEACAGDFALLDYLHLDDSHAEAVALRNVRAWLPKLRPGGVLVLDDCCWESVRAARAVVSATCELVSFDASPGRRWEIYRVR